MRQGQTERVPPPNPSRAATGAFEAGVNRTDGVVSGYSTGVDATRWAVEGARNIGGKIKKGLGANRKRVQEVRKSANFVGKGARGLGYASDVLELYRDCRSGSSVCRQTATDVAGERLVDAGSEAVMDSAYGAASNLYPPLKAAYPAWKSGQIVGGLIREVPAGDSSVGSIVDDVTWEFLVNPVLNKLQTGYWDPFSDDAIEAGIRNARKRLKERQKQFDRIRNENDEANKRAAALQVLGSGSNSCQPAKQLDPATGCHIGHDEDSHPGGCKCSSGS